MHDPYFRRDLFIYTNRRDSDASKWAPQAGPESRSVKGSGRVKPNQAKTLKGLLYLGPYSTPESLDKAQAWKKKKPFFFICFDWVSSGNQTLTLIFYLGLGSTTLELSNISELKSLFIFDGRLENTYYIKTVNNLRGI